MPTIREVADLAGVAVGTVSHVIHWIRARERGTDHQGSGGDFPNRWHGLTYRSFKRIFRDSIFIGFGVL